MDDASWFKQHWKLLVNLLTIVALLGLAYAIRDQLVTTFSNLGKVKAWALFLLVPIEALNYHAPTRLYQKLVAMVDEKLSYAKLFKASLELNFVNHVFPSGGVAGISYFGLTLRRLGVRGTKATLVQT